MLKSHFDTVVIGKNYLSFILSLLHMRSNSSFLMIDDERVKFGENWQTQFGEMEKQTLELIGHEFNIQPLKQIQAYLQPTSFSLSLNQTIIELGNGAFENLREIARKIPDCFSKNILGLFEDKNHKEFNRQFELSLTQLTRTVFNLKNLSYFEESHLDKSVSSLLKMVLTDFLNHYHEKSENSQQLLTKQFIFALQGKFQSIFSDNLSDLELKYLILQVLSPRYVLNEAKLVEDLQALYISQNGLIKKTTIQYWQFYQKKLSSVLLSSYEGVIHTDKTFYIGNLFPGVPFDLNSKQKMYTNMKILVKYPRNLFDYYKGRKILFLQNDRIGSDYPLWEADFIDEKTCLVSYLYLMEAGTKPEFFFDLASNDIAQSFSRLFVDFTSEKIQDTLVLQSGLELWSESFKYNGKTGKHAVKSSFFGHRDIHIKQNANGEEIKEFQYWGQHQFNALGFFSFLIDLKNSI
ncbi:MAG: hypothetical protein JNM93_09355 [Bacteriovoracaceae bacterium]|nr:hypothetical protein [Bacteriovoracaceae bacterium]